MRLPVDAGRRTLALGLIASLAACGVISGEDGVDSASSVSSAPMGFGPEADYPMVLGDSFTVDGEVFTPTDALNYDSVGYASLDGGSGTTAAHRTLPLPSYAEVTSLENGKTVLVRIERRGPLTGTSLVALSASAAAQLDVSEGSAIRVRRVNPIEAERAELRAGRSVAERIATPKALVEVLRRKLPASGSASLQGAPSSVLARGAAKPTALSPDGAGGAQPVTAAAYPLTPLVGNANAPAQSMAARGRPAGNNYAMPTGGPVAPVAAAIGAREAQPAATEAKGGFVIQAGAFANEANARRAAKALGGYVAPLGKLYRVRTGPFASRGQADAALAKVRAAGYSDARVFTAG